MKYLPQRQQPTFNRQRQSGFVLILVVFLIVVLGGAAVAISRLTVDSSGAQNQALQKTRAQWFSQSGVEWAVQELVTEGTDCNRSDIAQTDFPGLTLTIECSASPPHEGFVLWTVTATAASDGRSSVNEEYVWHRMQAVVERAVAP